MSETVTVNLAFKIKIPVERDECGRRKNPMLTLSRYIDGFFGDLRINQNFVHEHEKRGSKLPITEWNYPRKADESVYLKVSHETLGYFKDEHARLLRLRNVENERIARQNQFVKVSDEACQRLFKMPYSKWQTLDWAQRGEMMRDAKVEFDNINGGFRQWSKA